jgi:hypothetical protein
MRGGEADALKGSEFAGAFRKLLRDVAANAPGALQRDSLMAGMEFSSLYSATEIVSGICAADATFWPSMYPDSFKPWRNGGMRSVVVR